MPLVKLLFFNCCKVELTETQNSPGWKWPQKSSGPTFHGKRSIHYIIIDDTHCPVTSWNPQCWGLHHVPGKVVPVTDCSHCKKFFLTLSGSLSLCSWHSLPLAKRKPHPLCPERQWDRLFSQEHSSDSCPQELQCNPATPSEGCGRYSCTLSWHYTYNKGSAGCEVRVLVQHERPQGLWPSAGKAAGDYCDTNPTGFQHKTSSLQRNMRANTWKYLVFRIISDNPFTEARKLSQWFIIPRCCSIKFNVVECCS